MLRRITLFALVVSLTALVAGGVAQAGDTPWFDMDNCAMCKNVFENTALMENMTWEQLSISKGVVSITTVNAKYVPDYRTAHADMKKLGAKLEKGEKMDLCGSCMALGACMMKGVNEEYVETRTGDIWIITSDNKEVVAELQAWAKRNTEEAMKMMGKKKG